VLAKSAYGAFNREKPHSSITEWVEILTSRNYEDEAYDGIPELVDSINIQATGPTEASRAIRKKLKHGDSHQQYRAIVILRALVENGGQKFQTSFADSMLTDAIKHLATDSTTDPKVKKKVMAVLLSWHNQFKDDRSMDAVSNLYKQCKGENRPRIDVQSALGAGNDPFWDQKRREEREKKEEEKRKVKEAKEIKEAEARLRAEEEAKKKKAAKVKSKRKQFNFEEEKPQILTMIANASQTTNNLLNSITLVNTKNDSVQTNERVQECLNLAKQYRKTIVRYIQLVENEDMIGTLIDTNERIIAALETYDAHLKAAIAEDDVDEVVPRTTGNSVHDSELGKLQEKQRAAVQRSIGRTAGQTSFGKARADDYDLHPDLQDLNLGPSGVEQRNLQPPLRPTAARTSSEDEDTWHRGSLSDYSDYESSDEGAHNRASTSKGKERNYVTVSDDDEIDARRDHKKGLLQQEDDPFADPFAD